MLATAVIATAAAAFAPATLHVTPGAVTAASHSRNAVQMSEGFNRRELLGAALAFVPASAAFADGANSRQQVDRARAIYGSRIFRLQGKSAADFVEEKNAFTLFISGAFRSADVKPTAKALTKLASDITKAAEKGDSASANSKLKDFIKIAKIEKELDTVDGGNFNPKQRRNPGAPPTSEVEAQMGSLKYALYDAVKK